MIFSINGLCIVFYKFCKFQANWIKIRCTWFFKADPYSLEITMKKLIYPWISESAIYMLSPELNYIQVKFGVNSSISFEVTGQSVILYRWSINGWSWLVLHFQVLLDSIDLTWRHVAKSSHLAANVMTDRQTHTHTHTETDRQTDTQTNRVMGWKT